MKHYSVMLEESINGLNIKSNGVYVDATLGYGGHSSAILKRLEEGRLYSFDQDRDALNYSDVLLKEIGSNYTLIKSNFVDMKSRLAELGINEVDGIIFDLGLSSPQIDEISRGFTFMEEAPLDMRMDLELTKTAEDIVNSYSEEELSDIFFKYGEEKQSRVIASHIVKMRKNSRISTTKDLVDIIEQSVGAKYFYAKHPERQIFQAIRIEVNEELKVLERVLPDAISMLKKGGRISVITFHSLEDRIVKQIFKKNSEINDIVKGLPVIPDEYKPIIKLINKKPIIPTEKELSENTRSRSAKLRIVERI